MTTKVIGLRRLAFGVAAAAVATAVALPVFSGTASAGQLSDRYIKLDTSKGGATGQYEISFELAQAHANLEGVAVDFCTNPLPGQVCTKPTGLSQAGSPTVTAVAGATGSWTGAQLNSNRTLSLTKAAGDNLASGATVTFTVTGLTNPTADNATFYARIFTFTSDTDVATWAALNSGDGSGTTLYSDYGGLALSTAAQITITAKVQEQLSFCIYLTSNTNCAGGGTGVSIGNANGVLSSSGAYVNKDTTFDVSTNANAGATIRMKGGLPTSGSNTLTSIGTTGTASNPGNTQFGLCAYRQSGANLSIVAPYNNAAADGGAACQGTTQTAGTGSTGGDNGALFAYDTTPATATYGDDLATVAAGSTAVGRIAYIGNIAVNQAAGVYTNTYTFVATGQY